MGVVSHTCVDPVPQIGSQKLPKACYNTGVPQFGAHQMHQNLLGATEGFTPLRGHGRQHGCTTKHDLQLVEHGRGVSQFGMIAAQNGMDMSQYGMAASHCGMNT